MTYGEKRRLIKQQKEEEQYSKYTEGSKKSLAQLAGKRFQTVFVGAIAQIEECFGELWGEAENLDESEMTPQQLEWYNKFLDVRDAIFDNGNDQRQKFKRDLDNYEVHRLRTELKSDRKDHNGRG